MKVLSLVSVVANVLWLKNNTRAQLFTFFIWDSVYHIFSTDCQFKVNRFYSLIIFERSVLVSEIHRRDGVIGSIMLILSLSILIYVGFNKLAHLPLTFLDACSILVQAAMPMLLIILPVSLVPRALRPFEYTITLSMTQNVDTLIRSAIGISCNALSVWFVVEPGSTVLDAVHPIDMSTFTMHEVLAEIS